MATTPTSTDPQQREPVDTGLRAGIGLRLPHISEVVATRPNTGWIEIHPENFLANPHAAELLLDLKSSYSISVHTVGISIGSAHGLDWTHLERIRALVDALDPIFVSGHLAWSTWHTEYLNDLLPVPYTDETLSLAVAHVREAQDYLGRPYLVENPASYIGFRDSTMKETEFLSELTARAGCRLLCDVSNIHVSAHNMAYDARDYIERLPWEAIAEVHLGGYTPEEDPATPGQDLLVDTHAASISDGAWKLYAFAVQRFGLKPTLIEWDSDLPDLSTLLAEAARADTIAGTVLEHRNALAR